MVLRRYEHNAEHWLAAQLNAYLRDDDEYRHHRETIIRGLASVIAFAPATITVTLEPAGQPASPAPSPCSSTRSTHTRPPFPATRTHHLPHRAEATHLTSRSTTTEVWG